MTDALISKQLEDAIHEAVAAAGVKLGHGNEFTLPDMARRAANVIAVNFPEGAERDDTIARGKQAYGLLIAEMTRAAQTIPDYPEGIIGEQTLAIALTKLPPFPPFW